MAQVQVGRFTAQVEQEVTVFLIGMRFGALHRPDKWLPAATAMPRMLAHLAKDPKAGLLGYHQWFGRTTIMLSYWRSAEHLQRFASAPNGPHVGPWRDFVRRVGADPRVGIWHETYVVPPTHVEVVYANMPPFGLGGATRVVPVARGTQTARQRLGVTAGR
jgi:hypothetical protein